MDTKKTILIVDDSEFVRSYHSYILEQADFHVVTAVDGSDVEALQRLIAVGSIIGGQQYIVAFYAT